MSEVTLRSTENQAELLQSSDISRKSDKVERGCLTKNKFRQIIQKNEKSCHCEPVTDVTGSQSPPRFFDGIRRFSLLTGGFPRQCTHWLGMTVLLFVHFYFSETAPVSLYKGHGEKADAGFVDARGSILTDRIFVAFRANYGMMKQRKVIL